jgi:hypothetical protein
VAHPAATLTAGLVIFGALAAGVSGYRTTGDTHAAPAGSDSAAGQAVLDAHFPKANASSGSQLLLRLATPAWDSPSPLGGAQRRLAADPVFASIAGPLGTGAGTLTITQLTALHDRHGPAAALPVSPPPSSRIPARLYQAYRATAQFISPDGRTIRYYAALRAGTAGSAA